MLATRIVTGVLFGGALTTAVLLLPPWAAATVLGALWLIGAWEWGALARFGARGQVLYALLLALLALGGLLAPSGRGAEAALAVALAWWAIAMLGLWVHPRGLKGPTIALAGILVLLPSWVVLAHLQASEPGGRALAMTVLVIVWAADVGAYAFGRMLGRVKLAPAISPGKTWEGVSGGVLAAALVSWLAARYLDTDTVATVAIGVATALVSVVGDLTVSLFKRNVGVKDSGRLLPGHGGVLDRIDSLTAAIPMFVFGLWLAGLL